MDIAEFQRLGFLQEANRLFFHPLGLALEVRRPTEEGDPPACISGIWDYRDDPEGVIFGGEYLRGEEAITKAANVAAERERHVEARKALLGSVVQELRE